MIIKNRKTENYNENSNIRKFKLFFFYYSLIK